MASYKPMKGKVCMVTGANSGIGKVTAYELARKGAHVVMVCRNREKGEEAQREIQTRSKNSQIDLLLADFSSLQSIHHLVDAFKQKYQALNVLLNNAGSEFYQRQESVDGIEMTLAVDHLAPFLLTNLLLDVLKSSASARIVNVNSRAHFAGQIHFDDIQLKEHYGRFGLEAYAQAKLINLLCTYELARHLKDTEITVNALHPGVVYTNIWKSSAPEPLKPFMALGKYLTVSAEEGAKTSIYLASSPEVAHVTGKYFVRCVPVRSSKLSYDIALQRQMWKLSEELIGSLVQQ